MSLIYKIDKPKQVMTVGDLILHLIDFDVDSQLVCINDNNQLKLLVCKEDPSNEYHREGSYDIQCETKPMLTISSNNVIYLEEKK